MTTGGTDRSHSWYPIASSTDLVHRSTFHAQILGRELVVWRADDDVVNVWENRCLHRGLRLTRGLNDGTELTCQYHGWRYSSVTGGCTYIPAHPADAPARTIYNRTFLAVERYGLLWTTESGAGEPPVIDEFSELNETSTLALRPIPVNAPAELVLDELANYAFRPSSAIAPKKPVDADWREFRNTDEAQVSVVARSEHMISLRSVDQTGSTCAVFFVQPVDSARVVIRGVLDASPTEPATVAVLRHHSDRLARLRDRVHQTAADTPMPAPLVADIAEVPVELSTIPDSVPGRGATIRVQVARKWQTASDTMGFELTPIDGVLDTFQPGAHIDVHLPNGLIRQYSLTNRPGELDRYRIGVKREPESRGGSSTLHDSVREGDVLAVSAPRNNFSLRRDALRTVFIAGGIGITPLLAMAHNLDHSELEYELHLFVRTADAAAFPEQLESLAPHVHRHLALNPAETGARIRKVLGAHDDATHVYVCGPGPMIAATREIAADLGWPDDAVHFEYFANTTDVDDSSSFEIALARSAVTLQVSSGETILNVLRNNGIKMASSCEQGACGTCLVAVLDGEPLHQDVYLNATEHAAGDRIATCVSRSVSARLVLDL